MKASFSVSLLLLACYLLLANSTLAGPPTQRFGSGGQGQSMGSSQVHPQFQQGRAMPGVQRISPLQSQPQSMYYRGQTGPGIGKIGSAVTQPSYAGKPDGKGKGGPGWPDGKGKPGKHKHPHWPHHPHWPVYPVYPVYPTWPSTSVSPSMPSVSSSWDYALNPVISDIPTMSASSQAPVAPSEPVVVVNPQANGITIRFMVNNQLVELPAGKLVELPSDRGCEIAFDRGGSYGTARYSMQSGIHTFTRTAQGWELFRSNSMESAMGAPTSTLPSNPIP